MKIQKEVLKLPVLLATTIGSFPQIADVRASRKAYNIGDITGEKYDNLIRDKISEAIRMQEDAGLDVLVHGEYERNDMWNTLGKTLRASCLHRTVGFNPMGQGE